MPVNTVTTFIRDTLNGTVLPLALGNLEAVISPVNPGDGAGATAYIWGSHGVEKRQTVPRAQHADLSTGGNKTLTHSCDVWLVWFGSSEEDQIDLMFPAILDTVMGVLRNVQMLDATQHAHDPVTGQLSNLLNMGENMTWDYGPVRATADQRWWRYDAVINVEVVEIIQA